ncbi:hypothetical protein PSECIP111854_01683 [Pseudoalteromonas sp. CIP111854]|uniref:HTH cro/C1-type domain-containing protein n=1 Tax=Pseudoalteromonas holothuriae TaxID=2963714 RepID=A0A9W4VUD1_9GAMM|nr:helix-turn-helix transcriptional regulator [Pseudoalteromonas sp. CIP111854]CAH9055926.1 hypothetical protein PSECIP111854_01683 [Pseudoalteromonas sp. CIP111854]
MIDGDDLKAMRVNAGITQQGMSDKLKCDRKTIINYELGVSDIPSKLLFKWLSYCRLDFKALLHQVKQIREEARDNGKSTLLDIVTLAFILSQLWSDIIVTPLYLSLLGICAAYGVYRKDINMTHIPGFIFVLTAINFAIFEVGLINYVAPESNKLLQSALIYGSQLLFSLAIVLVLIFRVQLSRLLSSSNNIELTHFDGIFHWIYIYTSLIYFLALVEDMTYIFFDMKSWTLIYDNFEGLIYISWALCCGALLTMMIVEAKSNRSGEANAL